MKKGKETLCWGCQNFSKCSWSKGIPVNGWDATPTIIKDIYNGDERIIHSYCVNSCPQYLADKLQKTNTKEMAAIFNINRRSMFRRLAKSPKKLTKQLAEKGYKLHKFRVGSQSTQYYLEKIGGANESKN